MGGVIQNPEHFVDVIYGWSVKISEGLKCGDRDGVVGDAGAVDRVGRAGHVPVRVQRRRHQLSLRLHQGKVNERDAISALQN